MIKTKLYIEKYDWVVTAYVAVTHYETDQILFDLRRIGCSGDTYDKAEGKLRENEINSGLTYSSKTDRESVMVTALSSSTKQQFNTICHEICHVCAHIASVENIDTTSEEFAYLVGDLSMDIFPDIKHLLCNGCRIKYYGRKNDIYV